MDNLMKININAILCANSDEKVTSIENIFNVLKRQADDRLTFDIVTIINAFGDEIKGSFTLVYAFVKLESDKSSQICIVDTSSFEIKDDVGDNNSNESNIYYKGQMYSRTHIDNMYFPGVGEYVLQVYKFDDEVNQEKIDKIKVTDEYDNQIECMVNFEIVE